MKLPPTVLLTALIFASCNSTTPPRPRHVGVGAYMGAPAGSTYLGEAEDHAFRKKPDGAIIFTDTADLPASEQAKIRSAGKTYTGPGSKVRWH